MPSKTVAVSYLTLSSTVALLNSTSARKSLVFHANSDKSFLSSPHSYQTYVRHCKVLPGRYRSVYPLFKPLFGPIYALPQGVHTFPRFAHFLLETSELLPPVGVTCASAAGPPSSPSQSLRGIGCRVPTSFDFLSLILHWIYASDGGLTGVSERIALLSPILTCSRPWFGSVMVWYLRLCSGV
jgi:hypothetical protein